MIFPFLLVLEKKNVFSREAAVLIRAKLVQLLTASVPELSNFSTICKIFFAPSYFVFFFFHILTGKSGGVCQNGATFQVFAN